MHSILALEISVGELALKLDSARLHAHLITGLIVQDLDLIAVSLTPAGIHSEQHIGPIQSLGSTRSGIDIHNCAEFILVTAQHITQLESLDMLCGKGIERIKLLLGADPILDKLGHQLEILNLLGNALVILNPTLDGCHLLELLAGTIGVIPEVWLLSSLLLVLQVDTLLRNIQTTI